MEFNVLKDIFLLTAKRSIKKQSRYFMLDKSRLSEPEIRHVMAKILEKKKIYHAIEVATKERHKLSGVAIERSALTDLVIYGNKKTKAFPIWVEFKRGQPEIKKIVKDFIKMMKEPSIIGVCFYHILPKINSARRKRNERAKNAIIEKYYRAYRVVDKSACHKKWFILFILDARSNQYYILKKDDICKIDTFADGKWRDL